MTNTVDDSVYTRISKLLALANNKSATEAEAALAAEHVQRLLQEHNLTLSEVEAKGGNNDGSGQREKHSSGKADGRGAMYAFQRSLMSTLAENNFCLHRIRVDIITHPNRRDTTSKSHQLVGRALNVRVTLDTYDYLYVAMRRGAQDTGYDPNRMTRELSWFYDGVTTRLVQRLQERRTEAENKSSTPGVNGTHRELVLSDVYGTEEDLNNDFLNGFPSGTTATKKRAINERNTHILSEIARMKNEGMDYAEAWYRGHGYGERSVELATDYNRRSSRRSGGHGRGHATNWTQGNQRQYQKVNSSAYQSGLETGAKIGLDAQVGKTNHPKIGRS